VRAVPGRGAKVPVWILGSSLFGAQLAAMLGLPYAFASHFAPQQMMQAIEVYRANFKPSAQLDKPYVMLGFNVFAADTDERRRCCATSMQQAFVNLRSGRPVQAAAAGGPAISTRWGRRTRDAGQRAVVSAIGSPETVRRSCRPSSSAPAPTN
jgi:luciferase family oxidoreductase group 1